jgi:DnaJ-domain-containing protein 1
MYRDGKPQDPWFEKFNARRATMDKQFVSFNAKLNAMFDDVDAKLQQLLHQSHRSKS